MRKLSMMLVFAVCLMLSANCSGEDDLPTRVAPHEIEAQLSIASPKIASWLRKQEWVHDEDEATLRAVIAIVSAQYHPTESEDRQGDVYELIRAVDGSPWYTGKLSRPEKLFLVAVFQLYAESAKNLPPVGDTSRPPEPQIMPDYPWVKLLGASLRNKLHVSHLAPDGGELQLIGLSAGDTAATIGALDSATILLGRLESLLGAYHRPYILFIEDEALTSSHGDVCGQANAFLGIVTYKPSCLGDEILAHELTHLVTPEYSSVWFEEGTAYLLGAYAAGIDPARMAPGGARSSSTFHIGGIFDQRPVGAAYYNEAIAGLYFLYDYVQFYGYGSLSQVLRTQTDPLTSDSDLLSALINAAPPDRRRFVPSLIAERCRVRRGGAEVPC